MTPPRLPILFLALFTALACDRGAPSEPANTEASPSETAAPEEPTPSAAANPQTNEHALTPEACNDLLGDPAGLLELSKAAWSDGNRELGYRYAALVRQLYPDSPESEVAFQLAAPNLSYMYTRHRNDPTSQWTTSEPIMLIEWLADLSEGAEEFPIEHANLLLEEVPKSMRLIYEDYAGEHPVLSKWKLRFKMENGLVEYVSVVPQPGA